MKNNFLLKSIFVCCCIFLSSCNNTVFSFLKNNFQNNSLGIDLEKIKPNELQKFINKPIEFFMDSIRHQYVYIRLHNPKYIEIRGLELYYHIAYKSRKKEFNCVNMTLYINEWDYVDPTAKNYDKRRIMNLITKEKINKIVISDNYRYLVASKDSSYSFEINNNR